MHPIRLALVGVGKIAREHHRPAIESDDRFVLAACVSREECGMLDVPHAATLEELFAQGPELDAIVLCTPPQPRYGLAMLAMARGLHVFLEKPPCTTVREAESLREEAAARGLTLFVSWHSRFASVVEPARNWLKERRILGVSVIWHEDVRLWHPGQSWIWEQGGFGVFDTGINALSLLTYVLPCEFVLAHANLVVPKNRATPIAARLKFSVAGGGEIDMDLDWRQTGSQKWVIVVETDAGKLTLSPGGSELSSSYSTARLEKQEYLGLYDRFATLIRTGTSDVDIRPLQLVADAFRKGSCEATAPFYD
jgi:D-galactose 1-dehydrogenase